MSKDSMIKDLLADKVSMTPNGFVAEELTIEQFGNVADLFFNSLLNIHRADISGIEGYGEFNASCQTEYVTCEQFLVETFAENKEGYWYNWKEMFEITPLKQDFFDTYFNAMKALIPYCEGQRYLVNNNTFFINMITDGKTTVGFPDWSRSGIADFLLDIAIMDLNKPYLHIPQLFYAYCQKHGIVIPNLKQRLLCMSYYKGIDVLRWHASIDDTESCLSIIKSIGELEDRLNNLE